MCTTTPNYASFKTELQSKRGQKGGEERVHREECVREPELLQALTEKGRRQPAAEDRAEKWLSQGLHPVVPVVARLITNGPGSRREGSQEGSGSFGSSSPSWCLGPRGT